MLFHSSPGVNERDRDKLKALTGRARGCDFNPIMETFVTLSSSQANGRVTDMRAYEREFLDFALETGVLKFGEFTLKSGRSSLYFFNSGLFSSGSSLARLGSFYASAILASGIDDQHLAAKRRSYHGAVFAMVLSLLSIKGG